MPGSNCTTTGITLATLPLQPGYWRTGSTSADARRCPDASRLNGSGCQGMVDAPCRPGLTSVYCLECLGNDTYYDAGLSDCRACAPVRVNWEVLLGLVFGFTLCALLVAMLRNRRCPQKEGIPQSVSPNGDLETPMLVGSINNSNLSATLGDQIARQASDLEIAVSGPHSTDQAHDEAPEPEYPKKSAHSVLERLHQLSMATQRLVQVLMPAFKICW